VYRCEPGPRRSDINVLNAPALAFGGATASRLRLEIAMSVAPLEKKETVKKLIIGLAAGATVFGGVYGLAASLGLTSDSLGAGQSVVAACQATAMNATYTSAYTATVPGYTVTTVTLTGLTSTCYSKPYRVTLSGAAGASLAEVTGTTPSTGATVPVTFSNVNAASITGVSVVISG
jgi:hypothetical protein